MAFFLDTGMIVYTGGWVYETLLSSTLSFGVAKTLEEDSIAKS